MLMIAACGPMQRRLRVETLLLRRNANCQHGFPHKLESQASRFTRILMLLGLFIQVRSGVIASRMFDSMTLLPARDSTKFSHATEPRSVELGFGSASLPHRLKFHICSKLAACAVESTFL